MYSKAWKCTNFVYLRKASVYFPHRKIYSIKGGYSTKIYPFVMNSSVIHISHWPLMVFGLGDEKYGRSFLNHF